MNYAMLLVNYFKKIPFFVVTHLAYAINFYFFKFIDIQKQIEDLRKQLSKVRSVLAQQENQTQIVHKFNVMHKQIVDSRTQLLNANGKLEGTCESVYKVGQS